MPFDPRAYCEQHLAELDAQKDVYQAQKEYAELRIEQIDIDKEAIQEWLDTHPA